MKPSTRRFLSILTYMTYVMIGCMVEDLFDCFRNGESTGLITLRIISLAIVVTLQSLPHKMKKLEDYKKLKSKRLKYQMRRERRKAEARKHCSIRENDLYGP